MIKKIILFSIIIFLFNSGCGFTPKYKGFDGIDFILVLNESKGDRDLNNRIESQLKRYKKNNESYETVYLNLESRFEKKSTARDSKGEVTKYNIVARVYFDISIGNETRKVSFIEEFKIDKIEDSVEENNYFKIIKNDFAYSIVEKLIVNIRKNK